MPLLVSLVALSLRAARILLARGLSFCSLTIFSLKGSETSSWLLSPRVVASTSLCAASEFASLVPLSSAASVLTVLSSWLLCYLGGSMGSCRVALITLVSFFTVMYSGLLDGASLCTMSSRYPARVSHQCTFRPVKGFVVKKLISA